VSKLALPTALSPVSYASQYALSYLQESAIPRLRQKESKTVRYIGVRDLDFKDAESMKAGSDCGKAVSPGGTWKVELSSSKEAKTTLALEPKILFEGRWRAIESIGYIDPRCVVK
jgi:hypothetical protein